MFFFDSMEKYMKVPAVPFFVLIAVVLFLSGCSEEEQPAFPVQKSSVRKPIKMPEQENPATNAPAGERETVTEEKKVAEIEIASMEIAEAEKKDIPEEEGVYLVRKGDTLSGIAGRDDVYGDPLKWPLLYRLNTGQLGEMGSDPAVPDREITEGTRLETIEPEEAREVLRTRSDDFWVVNVLSSPKNEKVVPVAIKLMKEGYPVYLTRVRVKGRDWIRVRTGFFHTQQEAGREGNKIKALMNIKDIWITRADEQELEEFGGYL